MKKLFITCIIAATTIFTACEKKEDTKVLDPNIRTVTMEHRFGKTEIKGTPKRVVVFDLGTLDNISQIAGVEVVGIPKLSSGVPDILETYKDEEKYQRVGTLFEPNFEKLFELKPDLIMISGRQGKSYEALSEIAPTVYFSVDGRTYFEDLEKSIKDLNTIFGNTDKLEDQYEELVERSAKVKEKAKDHEALFVMTNGGSLSVLGEGTRFDQLYSAFGFNAANTDVQKSNHGDKVSYEYLYEVNPEYMFVLDRGTVVGKEISGQETLNNGIVQKMSAFKENKIVYVNPQNWYIVSGGITSGLKMVEEMEKALTR